MEFPKSLPNEDDARVIGINYQLIDEPTVSEKDRVKPAELKPVHKKTVELSPHVKHKNSEEPSPPPPKPLAQKPQLRQFTVRVRRTAALEDEIKVGQLNSRASGRGANETFAPHERWRKPPTVRPGFGSRADAFGTDSPITRLCQSSLR